MELQHTECSASIWPHRHTDEMSGPLDIKISFRNQPPVLQTWPKKRPIWVRLDQPDERTNLTLLQIWCNLNNHPTNKWSRINQYRILRDGGLKFYLRVRLVNSIPHPIPRGRWPGTCTYTDQGCMFTFQAMTMKVKPKDEPRIILPDGSLPAKKNIKLVIP